MKDHFKSGIKPGICCDFLIGLLTQGRGMFNEYAIFNITAALVWQWFAYGMIQMIIYGILVSYVYKPKKLED